ncbi:transglutaminase [Bifidobacterium lemurum]|uniref:Transglutaminase n=1 Tax=Bifidobacterium lemurum TaxID=1603886 RepID=A0A261FQ09_9BIFI|nr:transglutaminase domain-containing protein [Bifidobacterium lemurum]OZG61270.1 transglutaminase [Bifidobacterium lemurum]QOL34666.1 transglutaminase domain-containing protein [Bifidobacterium lemurum]
MTALTSSATVVSSTNAIRARSNRRLRVREFHPSRRRDNTIHVRADRRGKARAENGGAGHSADVLHENVLRADAACGQALRQSRIITMACVITVMLLAVANLIDVYGDLSQWASAAVPAVIAGAAIAWAGTRPAWRLWWQLVLLAASQCVLGPIIAVNHTTVAHMLPTWRTLALGWEATFGSFKYLIAIEPPTGTADGSLMAVWTIGLWFTLLAGVFAFAETAWLNTLSALPIGMAVAVCAWLGTDSGWHRAGCGILMGIMLTVWLSWKWRLLEWRRWRTAVAMLAVAVTIAGSSPLMLAQHRRVLRDAYDPPLTPIAYASPLSGFRSYIKDHRDETLLTVEGLPKGTPIRLAVMDHFDGVVWNLTGSTEYDDSTRPHESTRSAGSSRYRRMGTRIRNEERGEPFTATFTIGSGFTDVWLPLAGAATAVDFLDDEDSRAFFYNVDTDSGILPHGTAEGMTYTETGVFPAVPSDAAINRATAAHITQPQALDVPEAVDELASAIAGGQTSGGEAARALAAVLRESGWFSHGLEGDYPSLAGHGNYRITSLLSGDAMVGDDEQYASAMALMARAVGLPSRVVMGFRSENGSANAKSATDVGILGGTRGEVQGEIQGGADSAGDHGSAVSFTGDDIAAWVEINLSGLGWVAFHPTPDEAKTPNDDLTLAPPDPQVLVRQPPVPLTDPLRDAPRIRPHSSITGTDAERNEGNPFWEGFIGIVVRIILVGSPLWMAIILICGILVLNAARRVLARCRGTPRQRILAGWGTLCDLAERDGIPLSGSRRQQAADIVDHMPLLRENLAQTVRALGYAADFAAFSGQSIHAKQARRYWRHVDRLHAAMLRALPRTRRWRARLALRGTRPKRSPSIRDSPRRRAKRPRRGPNPRHCACPPRDTGRAPASLGNAGALWSACQAFRFTARLPDRRRGRPDRRRR